MLQYTYIHTDVILNFHYIPFLFPCCETCQFAATRTLCVVYPKISKKAHIQHAIGTCIYTWPAEWELAFLQNFCRDSVGKICMLHDNLNKIIKHLVFIFTAATNLITGKFLMQNRWVHAIAKLMNSIVKPMNSIAKVTKLIA